jgi:hypothetical protein
MKLKIFCTTKEKWFLNRRDHPHSGRKFLLAIMRQRTDNQNIQGAQKTKIPQNQ